MLNRTLSDRLRIRNISVIAHVDHGKTSLSDSLLSRAGQLSAKRLGECELDNLQEERDRGITIQSSAVSLLYDVNHETLDLGRTKALARIDAKHADNAASANDDDQYGGQPIELFIDNLPFHCSEESVKQSFDQSNVVKLNVRSRGSATLTLTDATLAEQLCRDGLRIDDRLATVALAAPGGGVMAQVRDRARELAVDAPTFDVETRDNGDERIYVCQGQLGSTRRSVRHAAARLWLEQNPSTSSADALPRLAEKAEGMLVNLIDSPGHVDFTAEVSSALRLTDGALVLVDAVSGPEPQTDSVLRQALKENVGVVLFLNKVDRAIGELQLSPDDLYDKLQESIAAVNATLNGKHVPLSFASGNVGLGSALEGWGVTLESTLQLYASRASDEALDALRTRLTAPRTAKRAFVELVLAPIYRVRSAIIAGHYDQALEFLRKVNRAPTGRGLEDWRRQCDSAATKQLLSHAMRLLAPVAEAVVNMVAVELPSPIEAQLHRAALLYDVSSDDNDNDDADDDDSTSSADEAGVLADIQHASLDKQRVMLFVAKVVTLGSRPYALCRVLSGTLAVGASLRLLPADGGNESRGKVSALALVVGGGRGVERVERAPAGSIVCVAGLSLSNGTATNIASAHALNCVSQLVAHVVGVALTIAPSCSKRDGQKKLVDALRALVAADPSLKVERNDADETVLLGAGELHLDVSISRLETLSGLQLIRSPPVVPLRETVVGESSRVCLGKSGNKHNRVFVRAEPLDETWRTALNAAAGGAMASDAARRAALRAAGVSVNDVRRVVAFGSGDNVLIDRTTGISVAPIADSLRHAFIAVEREGVLARNQPLTGVALVLVDVKYHADANHRGPAQLLPAATRAFTAALLCAPIRLVEPMLIVDVSASLDVLNDVYSVLNRRRAECDAADTEANGRGFVAVRARLAVRDGLGLSEHLRAETRGRAHPSLQPAGWQVVEHDPRTHPATLATIDEARARFGLEPGVPDAADDRL